MKIVKDRNMFQATQNLIQTLITKSHGNELIRGQDET
jgi:hypothetical protein